MMLFTQHCLSKSAHLLHAIYQKVSVSEAVKTRVEIFQKHLSINHLASPSLLSDKLTILREILEPYTKLYFGDECARV